MKHTILTHTVFADGSKYWSLQLPGCQAIRITAKAAKVNMKMFELDKEVTLTSGTVSKIYKLKF